MQEKRGFKHMPSVCEEMVKDRIVDFIIEFMEDVDKEIKDLLSRKLASAS